MTGKDGRKCVFIDQVIHGQLAAIVSLQAASGESGSLQGMVDGILAEWLETHPVRGFLIEGESEGE